MARTPSNIVYRPDVDGLRAVAVAAVLAYHLGYWRAAGGFVGVDVFFVISGYLICSVIAAELSAGRFSLGQFYQRRIRRIVPALVVVLAASALIAAFVLYPEPYRAFAESMIAAALSVSNILFWSQSGYFDAGMSTKPLLHTWSLGVEEQFYLIFPLLLAGLHRFASRTALIGALALIAAASLALAHYDVANGARAEAFYLPFTRFWELLLGALLALRAVPAPRGLIAEAGGAAGLGMIGAAVLTNNPSTPFPGLGALLPTLGAALVIWSAERERTMVATILSWRPIVFVGLISYSLYLWHWPLIVFATQALGVQSLTMNAKILVALVSFVLAALTWAFVEQPFRKKHFAPRFVFTVGAAGLGAAALAGALLVFSAGLPQRFAPEVARAASYVKYDGRAQFRTGACFISSGYRFSDFEKSTCLAEAPQRANILLLGDSHAADLWQAMSHAWPDRHLLQATASGCQPTLRQIGAPASRCVALMDYVFKQFLPAHQVDAVILSAKWSDNYAEPLAETLRWFSERRMRVILLGPAPNYDAPLPFLVADALRRRDPGLPDRHLEPGLRTRDARFAVMATQEGARYVSIIAAQCPQGPCRTRLDDGAPIYFDDDHFTAAGARDLIARLRLNAALSAPPAS